MCHQMQAENIETAYIYKVRKCKPHCLIFNLRAFTLEIRGLQST